MHYCRRDSHATSPTAIYANITQTGRIWIYCSWFWVVLVGFVGFVGGFGWFWVVLLVVLGGFGWFWVVPCFSNYHHRNAYLCLLVSSKSDRTDFRRLTLPVSLNVSLHGSHDLAIAVRLLLQSPMSRM